MSNTLYASLGWLPRPADDFSTRCRQLPESQEPGKEILALASCGLDENQLYRLATAIGKLQKKGVSLAPLTSLKLAVLSNSTTDLLVPALVATAARYGFALECIKGDYDQVVQQAMSAESAVNASRPDAVLIAVDYRGFAIRCTLGSQEDEERVIAAAAAQFDAIRSGIRAHCGATCIMQNLSAPPAALFGSFDRVLPGAPRRLIDRINLEFANRILGTPDLLLDVAGLAETVGTADWHSDAQWNLGKIPFSTAFLPIYAEHAIRLLAAQRGKSRRCLILDLDNTVWGGVIGDDGLEGISIAQGDATGEAHLNVQRAALTLRSRGVVLAICSKNNDETARLPMQQHPEMLLREEHIAVFQANWNDKATNITAIANELSLGLDAMVFLDDNPVERGLVREILPQVAVPELPEDPAHYARILTAAGYFESVVFSDEDVQRAEFYQNNARRVTLEKQAGDVGSYLASLNMEIVFQPFDRTGRARIAQLIAKSNQFNLTTRRYTEAQVAEIESDSLCFSLQVRLSDAFGDNGMISVVVCRERGLELEIDTWLMSCRVLGRRVEDMVLREILSHAASRGLRRIVGVYRPTAKNRLVVDHYSKLGFTLADKQEDGTTEWTLDVSTASVEPAPMTVVRNGFTDDVRESRLVESVV